MENIELKTEMTIKETIESYTALRDYVAGKSVKEMFQTAKDLSKEGEFVTNDTYFHALFLTEMMFENTNNSLKIVSGCDIVRFLTTLRSSFIECCKRVSKAKGDIKIVVLSADNKSYRNCLDNLREFFKLIRKECPSIEIKGILKLIKKEKEIAHYIVADSKMIRIEEPHGILCENDLASSIKAKVYFNAPSIAKDVSDSFDSSFFNK